MNTDIKFAANVILIDTEFLNNTIHEIRQVLSERIGRPLPPLDLVQWATCLLLDGGFTAVLLRKTGSTEVLCWYRHLPLPILPNSESNLKN